jgi:hypothetical protein
MRRAKRVDYSQKSCKSRPFLTKVINSVHAKVARPLHKYDARDFFIKWMSNINAYLYRPSDGKGWKRASARCTSIAIPS